MMTDMLFHTCQIRANGNRLGARRNLKRLVLETLEPRRMLASDGSEPIISHAVDYDSISPAWFAHYGPSNIPAIDGMKGQADPLAGLTGPKQLIEYQWIVRLDAKTISSLATISDATAVLNSAGSQFEVLSGLGLPGQVLLRSLSSSREAAQESLSANPGVIAFGLNEIVAGTAVPNDPDFLGMVNLNNVGQFGATPDADIDAPEAWDVTVGSPTVVVGVIDSGIDAAHPDLYLNIWLNQGEIPEEKYQQLVDIDHDQLITFYDLNDAINSVLVRDLDANGYIDAIDLLNDPLWADARDTDENGFVDDLFGWNFRDGSNEPFAPNNPSDNLGHGTHVAGTIGAIGNNGIGVTGINWRSSLMALKFLDQGNQGDIASAISAINYAVMMRTRFNTNVRVLNNSWGQPGGSNSQLQDSIAKSGDAGILFVAAAGNGNILGQGVDNDRTPFYPASYPLDNIIVVAATDGTDHLASFSNFGKTSVDIAAPGVGVLSTLPGGRYGEINGTSMATPHVSGTAAMFWSAFPDATPQEVRQAILTGNDPIASATQQVASAGRLNAFSAYNAPVLAPTASLIEASDIFTSDSGSKEIRVQFSHRGGIDEATVGDGDLIITREWGTSEPIIPKFKSSRTNAGGVEATYEISPPNGSWGPLDFGFYQIHVAPEQVFAIQSTAVRPGEIGKFLVQVSDPSVLYVNTTVDALDADAGDGVCSTADGTCSLRAAIQEANAAAPTLRTVILDHGVFELNLPPVADPSTTFPDPRLLAGCTTSSTTPTFSGVTSGDLDIKGQVQLIGNRTATTRVDARQLDRVFRVHPEASLSLSRLTVTGGNAQLGAGVLSAGSLRLDLASISDNYAGGGGGGVAVIGGNAEISRSTLHANTSAEGAGLFACNSAPVDVTASTIDSNSATSGGAAIKSSLSGPVQITNSTISGNTGGAILRPASGSRVELESVTVAENSGSVVVGGMVQSHNSIFVRNAADAIFFVSQGFNAIDKQNQILSDRIVLASSDKVIANLGGWLGPLLDNGGPTKTHAVASGSPTIDAADPEGNVQPTDQRGQSRPQDGDGKLGPAADLGAFEAYFGAIRGSIFHDLNGNGQKDSFESGGTGQSVYLDLNNNYQFDVGEPKSTDTASGQYAFLNLAPGVYNVGLTPKPNWSQSVLPYLESASVALGNTEANGDSYEVSTSADGRYIAYVSDASNLVANDTNGVSDVFVHDRQTGVTERISNSDGGSHVTMSADGRFVAFSSLRTLDGEFNLYVFDRQERTTDLVGVADTRYPNEFSLDISDDGNYLVFPKWALSSSGYDEIAVLDLRSSEIDFATITFDGSLVDADSGFPQVDASGRFIVFYSLAENLVPSVDSNGTSDIYVFDRLTRNTQLVSTMPNGQAAGVAIFSSISANGRFVAFSGSSILAGIPGQQVFVRDLETGDLELVSAQANDLHGNDWSFVPSISADGRFISFLSGATNLVPGDNNDQVDIFVRDRLTKDTARVNVSASGVESNAEIASFPFSLRNHPRISANGRTMTFATDASNLTQYDSASFSDVLVTANPLAPGANMQRIELYAGEVFTSVDFGVTPNPGSISGYCFDDKSGNGKRDEAEPVRAGCTIYLDLNLNGRLDSSDRSTQSDQNGLYEFDNLPTEREYRVGVVVPSDTSLAVPSTQAQGQWRTYLPAGAVVTDRDFGFSAGNTVGQFANGALSGVVFTDLNQDGIRQENEPGVPLIRVFLDTNNNKGKDFNEVETTTNALGAYSFTGLSRGTYTVRTILPNGTEQTFPLENNFLPPVVNSLGSVSSLLTNPQDVLVEDFDNDGYPDTAIAYSSGNSVSIRLNDGKGFLGETPIDVSVAPTGKGPIAIAAGHLNAGAQKDLVVANNLNGTATVLLDFNKSDVSLRNSGFGAQSVIDVGPTPTDIALGDFDGDGNLDFAVTNQLTHRVTIVRNSGNGQFTRAGEFSTGGKNPTSVIVGLFNGDAFLDLAVSNLGLGSNPGNVAVLLGQGDGTFAPASIYGVGNGPISVSSGDFNGDGLGDLVTADFFSNTATILLASASGSFSVDQTLGVGQGPQQVSVVDMDLDGDVDIVVTNLTSKSVSILRNRQQQGGSGFEPADSFGVAQTSTSPRLSFTVGDLDQNSVPDLVIVDSLSQKLSTRFSQFVAGATRLQLTGVEAIGNLNFATHPVILLPSIDPITNPEPVLEDASSQGIRISGIKNANGGPPVQITAVSSDTSIIPTPVIKYTSGPEGTAVFAPIPGQNGQVTITVSVRDAGADGTFNTADDGLVDRSFTVTIRPVNDPPTFMLPAARILSVLEDVDAQVVPAFVTGIGTGDSDADGQTLSAFVVTADHPEFFSAQPLIDEFGTLTFTPTKDAAGSTSVTVILRDSGDLTYGGSNMHRDLFILNIIAVNDAPSILLQGNQTVDLNATTQLVNNFATDFDPGGGTNESSQSIASFIVSTDRPDLFSVLPSIDVSGTLEYAPVGNKLGIARVSVRVRDNGGNTNGGNDLSTLQTFDIHVTGTQDTTSPTVSITTAEPNPTFRNTFSATVTFSEPVVGFELSDMVVINGAASSLTEKGPGVFTLSVTAAADGVVAVAMSGGVAQDAAGNGNLAPTALLISVDSGASSFKPLLTSSEPTVTSNRQFTATIDFGRAVTGFDASDLTLVNVTSTVSDLGSGRYRLDLQAIAEGAITVALAAEKVVDTSGRRNSASDHLSITYLDVSNSDFGDAPTAAQSGLAGNYPTKLNDNGARHKITSLFLGSRVDAEGNGQPSSDALGDDQAGTSDDEDGVRFIVSAVVSPTTATTSSVQVIASQPGKLDGWIDFNRDGDWLDAEEQIFSSVDVLAGSNPLSYVIPAGTANGTTFARFRLSSSGNLAPGGPAIDGEVEDYTVQLLPSSASTVLAIHVEDVGDHEVSVANGQLVVGQGSRTIFTVPSDSAGSVQLLNSSGNLVAQLKQPLDNLSGALKSMGNRVTLFDTSPTLSLTAKVPNEIVGVHIIDLTSAVEQTLQFQLSTIQAINSDKSLRIELGSTDVVQAGSNWKYDSVEVADGQFVPRFTQADASLVIRSTVPWQNPLGRFDVNGDGTVSVLDALLVINELNTPVLTLNGAFKGPEMIASDAFRFLDTDGNGSISALDALLVINRLNQSGGGEAELRNAHDNDSIPVLERISSTAHDQAIMQLDFQDLRYKRKGWRE